MELARTASKPIIIADTQDNPGAGGDSDTTGMLRALVRNNAAKAATGAIYDPASARAAHAAGVGATVKIQLGGKSGIKGDSPYEETFVVETCPTENSWPPVPITAAATWTWGHRRAYGSAVFAWL
jgi:microcystin degradation protein MlrC